MAKYFLHDEGISADEYDVIYKFLAFYKDQNVIVADSYRQDFKVVPLKEEKIIFKTDDDIFKSVNFCKRISYKGQSYIVELCLSRTDCTKNEPLRVREFIISVGAKSHIINLNTNDDRKRGILINILNIFDEQKIISPECEYCKRMSTNNTLQELIVNHEWNKIDMHIKQSPLLGSSLFIMKEGYESICNYTADFGTILYQLISFRINTLQDFSKKDLSELDKLILKLSKTELLRIQLYEKFDNEEAPKNYLLSSYATRVHGSQKYNVDNCEMATENKVLNKCIRDFIQR